jgi:hypothetical protein
MVPSCRLISRNFIWGSPNHVAPSMMRSVASNDVHSPISVVTYEMTATMMTAKAANNVLTAVRGLRGPY